MSTQLMDNSDQQNKITISNSGRMILTSSIELEPFIILMMFERGTIS